MGCGPSGLLLQHFRLCRRYRSTEFSVGLRGCCSACQSDQTASFIVTTKGYDFCGFCSRWIVRCSLLPQFPGVTANPYSVGIIGFIRIAINYNPDSCMAFILRYLLHPTNILQVSNLILEFGYWFNLDSLLSAAASQPIDRSSQRANSWPGLRVSYQNCLAKATYTGCRYQVQGRRALKRVVLSGLGTIDMTTATIMAIR